MKRDAGALSSSYSGFAASSHIPESKFGSGIEPVAFSRAGRWGFVGRRICRTSEAQEARDRPD